MDTKKVFASVLTVVVAPVVVYWLTVGHKTTDAAKTPMGPLEAGWNYDHDDLDPDKWTSTASASACSDMCYMRTDCRAMTYVVSNRSCWLKYAAQNKKLNADMISAVRKSPNSRRCVLPTDEHSDQRSG